MNIPDSYWSAEPPTKPGDYRWRKTDSHRPILVEVVECPETGGLRAYSSEHEGDFVTHPFFGGLWCRLVPAEEVERANAEVARLKETMSDILPALERASGCSAKELAQPGNALTADEVAALWMARAIMEDV